MTDKRKQKHISVDRAIYNQAMDLLPDEYKFGRYIHKKGWDFIFQSFINNQGEAE